MTLKTTSPFEAGPPVFLHKDLTTCTLDKHEHALAGQLLEQQHYLGDCPAGRQFEVALKSWTALSTLERLSECH